MQDAKTVLDIFKDALIGQYNAALSIFEDCVRRCPEDQWLANLSSRPFWHVAYHALYYTDLYLSPNLDSFHPPDFYRENYHYLGRLPFPPHNEVVADIPFDRETILGYTDHCRRKVPESVGAETGETLSGPCGFWWYKIPRADFHLNNIRHLQHHAAQMSVHLRRTEDIGIEWR